MIERLDLEKIFLTATEAVPDRELEGRLNGSQVIRTCRDVQRRLTMFILDYMIVGLPQEKISIHEQWPSDWWQAFRERWMPKWWLARWPVKYRTINVEQTIYKAVCPHLNVPDHGRHVSYLYHQKNPQVSKNIPEKRA